MPRRQPARSDGWGDIGARHALAFSRKGISAREVLSQDASAELALLLSECLLAPSLWPGYIPAGRGGPQIEGLNLQATAVASISSMILGSKSRVTPRSVLTGLQPSFAKIGTISAALAINPSTSVV
jgi:hypothetical protein